MNREQILTVLAKPYAQQLLDAQLTRLAYIALDGAPRVIPIAFDHRGDDRIVVCSSTNSLKVPALQQNPKVSMTIDTMDFPPKILLLRGTAEVELVDGIPEEYFSASGKTVPLENMPAWKAEVERLYGQMYRITINLTWAKLIDFEETLPQAVEELIRQKSA